MIADDFFSIMEAETINWYMNKSVVYLIAAKTIFKKTPSQWLTAWLKPFLHDQIFYGEFHVSNLSKISNLQGEKTFDSWNLLKKIWSCKRGLYDTICRFKTNQRIYKIAL